MPGALDGIVVADFSRVLAGPYATMLLADLGATVIKVERPGSGDDTRAWGPPYATDGQATYFQSINRNKLSIALDLESPDDLATARRIAARADVVIQNHKPGGLVRFGLDYASVAAANPTVVYCSISGFGSGAGADLPGYDLLVQAMGGLMDITGSDEPMKVGIAVVDVMTGLHAVIAMLAALRHREQTGVGQEVEVSLLSALQSSLVNAGSAFVGAGVVQHRMGNAHPSVVPYELYETADRAIVIAVGNDAQFARLCEAIGAPELSGDIRFATNSQRVVHRAELKSLMDALLATTGADEWQERISRVGVPCGPINDVAQGFALATRLGLDPVVLIDDPRRDVPSPQVANATRYSQTPATYRSAPPRLDEDREAVLALVGES